MNYLCQTDNFNIFFRSKSFEGKTDKVEQWYSTKHSVEDFTEEFFQKIKNPQVDESVKKLGVPPSNQFIATNFDVLPKNEDYSKFPQLLK